MSSIYPKGKTIYFRVKVDGKWLGVPSDFKVGQERQAKALLAKIDARQGAGEELSLEEFGPVTVDRFYEKKWIKDRESEVQTWTNDETVMRLHVLPTLGAKRIDEVTVGDVLKLIKSWRARKGDAKMAPRSVYTAYSTLCAFFRDAALAELIGTSPCMLTKRQLGPKVDAEAEWRPTAKFGRDELEALISDERVPLDRRVVYALQGIGAMRNGESSGLHWRNCDADPELKPLGMMFVAFSYGRALPKGDVCRPVPIHPTLAAILAEWKLHGWAKMMGRKPGPDDLVVPLPPHAVCKSGRWRKKGYTWDRLQEDLEALGLRHRRGHDLRRTMISLARSNGAVKDILNRATHKPPKEVIEGYTTFEWPVVCAEVLKLNVQRRPTGQVLSLRNPKSATSLATEGCEPMEDTQEAEKSVPVRVRGAPHQSNPVEISGRETSGVCESCGAPKTSIPTSKTGIDGSKVANDLAPRALRLLKKMGGAR